MFDIPLCTTVDEIVCLALYFDTNHNALHEFCVMWDFVVAPPQLVKDRGRYHGLDVYTSRRLGWGLLHTGTLLMSKSENVTLMSEWYHFHSFESESQSVSLF